MALRQGSCANCGSPMPQERITRTYCSDRCRKAAKRAEGYEPERRIAGLLRQRGLIAQVWPVFRSDRSPRVLALMVPRAVAVAVLNMVDPEIAEDDLVRALRRLHIVDWKQPVEDDLIERRARARGKASQMWPPSPMEPPQTASTAEVGGELAGGASCPRNWRKKRRFQWRLLEPPGGGEPLPNRTPILRDDAK